MVINMEGMTIKITDFIKKESEGCCDYAYTTDLINLRFCVACGVEK